MSSEDAKNKEVFMAMGMLVGGTLMVTLPTLIAYLFTVEDTIAMIIGYFALGFWLGSGLILVIRGAQKLQESR